MANHRILALSALLALACARAPAPKEEERAREPKTVLTLFAASSLKDATRDLEAAFEKANEGVDLKVHLAATSELRLQIEHGASADVFASADTTNLEKLSTKNLVEPGKIFAKNSLTVISPKGKPACDFEHLPECGKIVLGAPEVPVGKYALVSLEKATNRLGREFPRLVLDKVVSREANTRLVVAKIVLEEADAAIVYRTDAAAFANKIASQPLPADVNVEAEYPIATVTSSKHLAQAARFVDFVLSPEGQRLLEGRGFVRP